MLAYYTVEVVYCYNSSTVIGEHNCKTQYVLPTNLRSGLISYLNGHWLSGLLWVCLVCVIFVCVVFVCVVFVCVWSLCVQCVWSVGFCIVNNYAVLSVPELLLLSRRDRFTSLSRTTAYCFFFRITLFHSFFDWGWRLGSYLLFVSFVTEVVTLKCWKTNHLH